MTLAKIKGKKIIIEIEVDTLKEEYVIPNDLLDDDFRPLVKVTDPNKFAEYLVDELNREEEDGSTMITEILDKAYINAVENGADGCDLIEYAKEE